MFSINDNVTGYRPAFKKYADEDERATLAQQVFESFGCTATGVKELPKKTRNQVLKALCECGLNGQTRSETHRHWKVDNQKRSRPHQ